MIKKTKEGLQFCDQLIKESQLQPITSTFSGSIQKINCFSSLAQCESPSPQKKSIQESSFGYKSVKKVIFQAKDNANLEHDPFVDERKQQQRIKLVKQFPLPFSEQVPKKVEIQEICNFLRPRASSLETESQKDKSSQLFSSPKNNNSQNYLDKMVKENGKKLVSQFSQMKQKQSMLDKLTPRQYAWLTQQNVLEESPQNTKNFYKYAVIAPCQKNEDQQYEFTAKHHNSRNLIRMTTSHFNNQPQEQGIAVQSHIINDCDRSQYKQQSNSIQKTKILPSFTFNSKNDQDNIGNDIMITQIYQQNPIIEVNSQEYQSIQDDQKSNEKQQTQVQFNKTQFLKAKQNDAIQPRFLIFSKNLKQHQDELRKQDQEQYNLDKPDIVNTEFVNKLIMSAKHIHKIQEIHIQKQENIQKLNQNLKARLEEKIQKQREVARPPSKEKIEFDTYIREFDKNKEESQKRKEKIIYDLPINQQRRVIWKQFNVSNLSRSKSPARQHQNQVFNS